MIETMLAKSAPVSASPLPIWPRRASRGGAKISAPAMVEAMGIATAIAVSVSFAVFALAF